MSNENSIVLEILVNNSASSGKGWAGKLRQVDPPPLHCAGDPTQVDPPPPLLCHPTHVPHRGLVPVVYTLKHGPLSEVLISVAVSGGVVRHS